MARKSENNISLIDMFKEFNETKSIDRTTLVGVLEESFRNVIAKIYGSDEAFDVIVNPDKGDCEIYHNREVVADDEVTDPSRQISLTEAQAIDEDYEIGEEVSEHINFADFGRRSILTLRQTLASKILELEHDALYNKYKTRIGELVTAEVYQVWKNEILLLDDEDNEIILPKSQKIKSEFFKKGENIRVVIDSVEALGGKPKIMASRTSNDFLTRLLEMEIPEIADGLIRIRAVARIPGERAKIAVESYDDSIDPVGACVGVKGSRIHGIVRELGGENIDVIRYSVVPTVFIMHALAPANIRNINIDNAANRAEVFLDPDQVSLAIGKSGQNIKLASMMTGFTIDVFRDTDEQESVDDIYLDEFNDEIDQWIIDAIKKIGYDTARSVLNAPRELLVSEADLEEETVDYVLGVLRSEFEDEAAPEASDETPAAEEASAPAEEAPADAEEAQA